MPLIAHNDLPTYDRLKKLGGNVLAPGQASSQDIRELHIGVLNMMPDGALFATERQFLRLIGESNKIAQFYVHMITLPEIKRSDEMQAHIDQHYDTFENIQKQGLDALIITGTSEDDLELEDAVFWEPLQKVMDWAWENVTSTITACLATHAVMQFRYKQKRQWQDAKRCGIYRSRVLDRAHPIMQGMNTVFDVPHSRWGWVSRQQFEDAGMKILVSSPEGGVHLATSPDGIRLVCFQGHQEYDCISLFKEYKRDVALHLEGKEEQYPAFPEHYLTEEARTILEAYKEDVLKDNALPFPENQITPMIEDTWRDSARALIGNWIGLVYQLTHVDRTKPFMDGVDPNDPLNLKAREAA